MDIAYLVFGFSFSRLEKNIFSVEIIICPDLSVAHNAINVKERIICTHQLTTWITESVELFIQEKTDAKA